MQNKKYKNFSDTGNMEVYKQTLKIRKEIEALAIRRLGLKVATDDKLESFIQKETSNLRSLAFSLMQQVVIGNTYALTNAEWELRRVKQSEAIATCTSIFNELVLIKNFIDIKLSYIEPFLVLVDSEISLLKNWRQSDYKRRSVSC